MTDATPPEAPPAMRRRADLMVGLFVTAVVALLAAAVVFATADSAGLAGVLVVVALVASGAGVLVLRSIGPEQRALLTAPKAPTEETSPPTEG